MSVTPPAGGGGGASGIATITALLGAASTAFGIYTSVMSSVGAERAKKAETQATLAAKAADTALAYRKDDRDAVKSERDFTMAVFEKAYLALSANNDGQQRAALALVYALPSGEVRTNLISAFGTGGASAAVQAQAVKTVKNEADFQLQARLDAQAAATGRPAVVRAGTTQVLTTFTQGFDVDVFYCDGLADSAKRRDRAERLAKSLAVTATARTKLAGQLLGAVRVRPLPATTNLQPLYRISSDIVVYDGNPSEAEVAGAIAAAAKAANVGAFTAVKSGSSNSKYYISAFVCGPTAA